MSVLSYYYLGWSEGKILALLQHKDIVPYKISNAPYDNNYKKHYKACTVVNRPSEGKYYRCPINDNIVE